MLYIASADPAKFLLDISNPVSKSYMCNVFQQTCRFAVLLARAGTFVSEHKENIIMKFIGPTLFVFGTNSFIANHLHHSPYSHHSATR